LKLNEITEDAHVNDAKIFSISLNEGDAHLLSRTNISGRDWLAAISIE